MLLLSIIIGLILGWVSAQTPLVSSWIALLPWGAAGLVIGALARGRRRALMSGALYGFFLCAAFLIAGFKGQSIAKFSGLLIALSLLGALCGLILGLIGNWIKSKLNHEQS